MLDFRDKIFYSNNSGSGEDVPWGDLTPVAPVADQTVPENITQYEKYTWQAGDVITAARLNNIEDGVAAASKMVPTVTIINNSSTPFETTEQYYIRDGVLWNKIESEVNVAANAITQVVRIPFDAAVPVLDVLLFNGSADYVVASDTMNVEWLSGKLGQGYWSCAVESTPIPDDMTITISDPPLGEERTVAIQAGNDFVHNLPETVTGRVNEVVTITGVTTAGDIASVLVYYDENSTGGNLWSYQASGPMDDKTVSFRMPSTEVVSDTGYIQIHGTR